MRVPQTVNIKLIFNKFSCLNLLVHAILKQEYGQITY